MSGATIEGHPGIEYQSVDGRQLTVTVCAECGKLRTLLWLTGDRWHCSACRAEGVGRGKLVPVSKPTRRR